MLLENSQGCMWRSRGLHSGYTHPWVLFFKLFYICVELPHNNPQYNVSHAFADVACDPVYLFVYVVVLKTICCADTVTNDQIRLLTLLRLHGFTMRYIF